MEWQSLAFPLGCLSCTAGAAETMQQRPKLTKRDSPHHGITIPDFVKDFKYL
jgi:hypothetical protein